MRSLADLYRLDVPTLAELERMGKKSAENLVAAIEGSKHRTLDRLLTGLTIRHVGTRMAEVIAGAVSAPSRSCANARSRSSRRLPRSARSSRPASTTTSRTPRTSQLLDDLTAVGVRPSRTKPPPPRAGKLAVRRQDLRPDRHAAQAHPPRGRGAHQDRWAARSAARSPR